MFLQLWHVGRISHPSLQLDGAQPVAPSAICPQGEAMTYAGPKPFVTPRALDLEEIPGVIESYRAGAENALEAGFDGVEIHGANGYLLDQFLRSRTNHRVDAYGGSLENRARLLLEVTEAVCGVWGGERVGLRLSPVQPFNDMYDANPRETFVQTVQWLNRFNLAYLHITRMGKDNPGLAGLDDESARQSLVQIKGIGSWSADVYLLFALRRSDVWPRGDRALVVSMMENLGLEDVPTCEAAERLAQRWRPWRSVAARMLWHGYLLSRGRHLD